MLGTSRVPCANFPFFFYFFTKIPIKSTFLQRPKEFCSIFITQIATTFTPSILMHQTPEIAALTIVANAILNLEAFVNKS